MCNRPVPPPPEEAEIPHVTDTTGYLKGTFKTSGPYNKTTCSFDVNKSM